MASYILKTSDEEKEILLYQEKVTHTFKAKENVKQIKKITVLDKEMINSIWDKKIEKDYNRLIKIIYSLISSEDTTSGDVLVAYSEIKRIREYLFSLEQKGLEKNKLERYLKKLYVLELELKKVHVMELEEEIEEEKGRGR